MAAADPTEETPPKPTAPSVRMVPMPATEGRPPESGIPDRLRYARSELNLSVEALARLTKRYDKAEGKGVSASSLQRYEGAESLPGARELRILGEALDVTVEWLLLGEVSNAGKSAAQQALLDAMVSFVREVQGPREGEGFRAAEWIQWHRANERAEWITEARKPGAS